MGFSDEPLGRRSVLAGLAAFVAAPSAGTAAGSWEVGMQILAGTRLRDGVMLSLALAAIRGEFGSGMADRLLAAVLERDAYSIDLPFADPGIESAARRFVEIVYTGELPTRSGTAALGFHQALAWQVLHFTKAPSVCGPGFGWWTNPPELG